MLSKITYLGKELGQDLILGHLGAWRLYSFHKTTSSNLTVQ